MSMQCRYNIIAYKGNIVHTPTKDRFEVHENSYIVVEGEHVKGIYPRLPEEYKGIYVKDYGRCLIIPGFVDMHFHASQLANRGLGMDQELMKWLKIHTFSEEAKFNNMEYASVVYKESVRQMLISGTTRVSLYGTLHKRSSELLMSIVAASGLRGFVGKVSMDLNSPDYLTENTEKAITDEQEFILETKGRYKYVKPIITPRFTPATSLKLMKALGIMARMYNVPVQSHLSEDPEEVEFVRNLYPQFRDYASTYNYFGLFGQVPTIMAHCIYLTQEEMDLMARNKVYVAHCPISNLNLSGSIAPIRDFINRDIPVGLGTDIGAGHDVSIKNLVWQALQVAKVRAMQTKNPSAKLSNSEAYYLGTKGGGSFFGKVGSFEEGYDFDALVIDDSNLFNVKPLSIEERLERYIYIGDSRNIIDRYIGGNKVFL